MTKIGTIEIDTRAATKSINSLQQELKEAKKALNDLSIGSEEFEEQAAAVQQVETELKAVNALMKGQQSAYDTFQRGVIGSMQSIAGGAQTVVAAMQLFGSENEDVIKSLQKMQALMAFTSGLQSFKQLSGALNNIQKAITATNTALGKTKAAIAATGIGALLIILGALYTNWGKVSTAIDDFCNKTLGASWEKIKAFFKNFDDILAKTKGAVIGFFESVGDVVGAFAKTAVSALNPRNWFTEEGQQSIKQSLEGLQETFANFGKNIQEERAKALDEHTTEKQLNTIKKGLEELEESYKRDELTYASYLNKKLTLLKEQATLEKKLYASSATETLTSIKQTQEERLKHNKEIVKNNVETLKLLKDGYATQINDEKQQATQLLQNNIWYWKEKQKATQEGSVEYLTLQNNITAAEKKLLQERADMYLEAATQTAPVSVGDELSKLQAPEDTSIEDDATAKKEAIQEMLSDLGAQLQEFNNIASNSTTVALQSMTEAMSMYGDNLMSTIEKAKAGVETTTDEIVSATTAAISIAGSVTSNILQNAVDQQDQTSKEGFEKAKKLQIAQATIQMLTGVATALSGAFTTKSGPWDLILAIVQAATITASGLATIAQIKKQKYNSSSASTASVSTTAAASDATTSLSTGAIAGVENTSDLTDKMSNIKVYVTETDITNTQNKVETIESNNSY